MTHYNQQNTIKTAPLLVSAETPLGGFPDFKDGSSSTWGHPKTGLPRLSKRNEDVFLTKVENLLNNVLRYNSAETELPSLSLTDSDVMSLLSYMSHLHKLLTSFEQKINKDHLIKNVPISMVKSFNLGVSVISSKDYISSLNDRGVFDTYKMESLNINDELVVPDYDSSYQESVLDLYRIYDFSVENDGIVVWCDYLDTV